ncbi:MAG: sugar ABC transporter permease [Chloroflexota bacterium]|nr:MAG: sugar ABC transporter permease [Chloroflexota bacterium]
MATQTAAAHAITRRQSAPHGWLSEQTITTTLFLLPALAFLVVFIVWPILSSVELSFFEWNGLSANRTFVGLGNWSKLFGDGIFWRAFTNNIIIVVLSIAIQIPIAMALAVLLHRGGRKLQFFKVVYFFPLLMSTVAVGILFKYVYDLQFGVVTPLLETLGLKALSRDWLGDPNVALFSVIVVICWQFIPFYMVLFLAQLLNIPEDIHEAAMIDGATENQYFWRVELHLMRGIIATAITLSLIGSLKYFDLIWVMTEGGPSRSTELMATYMYKEAFASFHMGYGSTIATAMFIIVMIVALTALAIGQRPREA